jgi:hypothetical protein
VHLLALSSVPYPHPSKVSLPGRTGHTSQLAWLTDDMLNASIRSGGIAALVK